MTMTIRLGVAGYLIQIPTLEEVVIQPEGLATLSNRFGPAGAGSWTLSSALAPTVDIRTGLVSNRVQANASLSELMPPRLTLVWAVGGTQSVPLGSRTRTQLRRCTAALTP